MIWLVVIMAAAIVGAVGSWLLSRKGVGDFAAYTPDPKAVAQFTDRRLALQREKAVVETRVGELSNAQVITELRSMSRR